MVWVASRYRTAGEATQWGVGYAGYPTEVVDAVQGKIPVYVDSEYTTTWPAYVYKNLALGAEFVWIGRRVL